MTTAAVPPEPAPELPGLGTQSPAAAAAVTTPQRRMFTFQLSQPDPWAGFGPPFGHAPRGRSPPAHPMGLATPEPAAGGPAEASRMRDLEAQIQTMQQQMVTE